MKKILITIAVISATLVAGADIILTGIIDGSDSSPKGIEFYITGSMDLTGFTVESESNGGDPLSWSTAYTFSGTYSAGFYYLTSTSSDMINTFSSAIADNTIDDGSFVQNGNDAFRILNASSMVIDVFGDPSEVTDSADFSIRWAYNDSFAYRKSGVAASATFSEGSWYLPGSDYIDNNGGNDALAPFGTYVIPEPATFSMVALSGLFLMIVRRMSRT